MGNSNILSIDCGTQSARALLFDENGSLVGKEKVEFEPYFSEYPGWAEQDPEIYWESACKACKDLKEKVPFEWEKIKGVTVTTQRDTGVIVDRQGKALRPAIIWLDQRMAECSEPLPFYEDIAFKTVGMGKAIELTRKKSKSNWIKENQKEIWDMAYKYLLLSGFFIYKLTGKFIDSIGSQIGHIPFNYKKQCWPSLGNNYRWRVFGIERDKLYDLIEPGRIIGEITLDAGIKTGIEPGTPIISSGSDKGCETLGTGCLDTSCVSISFGTTATVQTTSNKYFEPLLFMPAYPSVIPGYYNPEVEIFRGYWMISWFKKEFASREMVEALEKNIPPEEILNKRLKDIPPGSNGLILQPYWSPGLKMPEAKGAIIGFGDVHTRAHIYRAIIEGINYALLDGIEKIENKSKNRVRKVTVSGGGSQSDAICQITADMLNRPVYRGQTYEASGLGSAISSFVCLGIHKSYQEAVEKMVHYEKIFNPDPNNVEIYSSLYKRVYKNIYPRLAPLYKEIQEITHYPKF